MFEAWLAVAVLALLLAVAGLTWLNRRPDPTLEDHVDRALALITDRPGQRMVRPLETPGELAAVLAFRRHSRARLFHDPDRHQCGPRCPDRPGVHTGPIVLGRRCLTCQQPTDSPDRLCNRCWDAEDHAFARRSDR